MLQFSSWVKTSITCEEINKGPTNPRSTSLKYRYSRVASEPALRLLTTMGHVGLERDATGVLRMWWVRKSACDTWQPGAQRSLWVPTSQQGCKSCSAVSLIMQQCRWSDKVNTETVFCLGFFPCVNTYLHYERSWYSLKLWVTFVMWGKIIKRSETLKFYVYLWEEQF